MTKKRLHRNLCEAVVEALISIFEKEHYADRVIAQLLKSNSKWGSRDRRFIAETIYEIVRYKRWYAALAGLDTPQQQDWWQVLQVCLSESDYEIPDWEEFKIIPKVVINDRKSKFENTLPIKESIPDWLHDTGSQALGPDWPATLRALNEQAAVVLRTNTLKTSIDKLSAALSKEGIETFKSGSQSLTLKTRQNVLRSRAFAEGWFEIQDGASQKVAPMLEVAPGMLVVDGCAGAGGKTLHLAALMQNKGKIIALDTDTRKLRELEKRMRRAGALIIETQPVKSANTIRRLYRSADRLLLDVPCSGLGVLRRNPDAKWKLSPAFLNEIKAVQSRILTSYAPILKKGGKMVYATCSILPSENQEQVRHFLKMNTAHFKLLKEKTVLPQDEGFDGFYMALIEKI